MVLRSAFEMTLHIGLGAFITDVMCMFCHEAGVGLAPFLILVDP
jgi:hypothetical protein